MIHAIDGCVPFLTPDVLEKHFPPSDDLWIGMAVRDTCVVPIMTDGKASKKNLKQQENGITVSKGEGGVPKDRKKPRGYTFAPVAPDSWLLPYTRVTVPSFNWMEDNAVTKEKIGQRPQPGSTSKNTHVLVWTPHGRQKLTPGLYAMASTGLNSSFTLSLYDMREDTGLKRVEKANARNKEWFEDLLKRRQDESGADDCLWSPILLPDDNISDIKVSHETNEDVAGVALIGKWRSDLQSLLQDRLKDIPHIAMLSTSCLSDILEIIASGAVDTIGTDLPNQWAQQKLAFVVDFSAPVDKTKRPKISSDGSVGVALNNDGCMDMRDKSLAEDPRPLVPGCGCFACAHGRFSRAYVHHLICAEELLTDVILFGHNLHHMLEMVRAFNTSEDRYSLSDSIRDQIRLDVNTEQ